jgi:hypothetical protein
LCKIRSGRKPDGLCLVVGTCARGFEKNTTSDVIFSSSSVKKAGNFGVQLFWEVTTGSFSTSDTNLMLRNGTKISKLQRHFCAYFFLNHAGVLHVLKKKETPAP